jgi:hypothetical protein
MVSSHVADKQSSHTKPTSLKHTANIDIPNYNNLNNSVDMEYKNERGNHTSSNKYYGAQHGHNVREHKQIHDQHSFNNLPNMKRRMPSTDKTSNNYQNAYVSEQSIMI